MPVNEQTILDQQIMDIPFSGMFKSFLQKNGFHTLREIVEMHVVDLLKIDGFTYHMLQEFVQYLEEQQLAHLIKQH